MKKEAVKYNNQQIVDYWFSRLDECGLSIDASEGHERCWRCGYKSKLERAHIVPAALGGNSESSNLVLLCKRCHIRNPNVADPEIMWDWLRAYSTPLYDTFWIIQGMKEYETIYGITLEEEFKNRGIDDIKIILNIFEEEMHRASYHFGAPYFNEATIAGLMRMTLKKYEEG